MNTKPPPIVVDVVPVAAAIGAFGVIYGATASTVIGPGMTITSSLLLFSGAAQFTAVALVDAGATSTAIVLATVALGLRHVPLSAILLPRLPFGRSRRALLALVLLDETAGLAVASPRPAARTMTVVGAAAYCTWVAGTAAGMLGADLLVAGPLASVVFVILFIGLSGLTCRSGGDAGRAAATAVITMTLLLVVPAVGALGSILVAVAVATTTSNRPS